MLYQVVVVAVLLGTIKPEPRTLRPQFEADDDEECAEKVTAWLKSTGYKQVEGSEIVLTEVPPVLEPEPEEEAVERLADEAANPPEVTYAQQLSAMKNPALRAEAQRVGADLGNLRSNAEIVGAILAHVASSKDGAAPTT